MASSPRSPTSQREEPLSSCQHCTAGGLALHLPHPPPRRPAPRGQGQTLAQGGAGALANRVPSCSYMRLPTPWGQPRPGAREAAQPQERIGITSGPWTLVRGPMMVPLQQVQPQASCSRPVGASRWRCAACHQAGQERPPPIHRSPSGLSSPARHLHGAHSSTQSTSRCLRAGQSPRTLPAMRMTARSAGSKTLPLPPGPPPLRRLRCVFSRFQGSVSPGLGEPLPPLEPSSTVARTSWSSPDMAFWRGSRRSHLGVRGVTAYQPTTFLTGTLTPPHPPQHLDTDTHTCAVSHLVCVLTPLPPKQDTDNPLPHLNWPHPSSPFLRRHHRDLSPKTLTSLPPGSHKDTDACCPTFTATPFS